MTYPEIPLDIVTRLFIDGEWVDFTSDVRGPAVSIKGRGSSSEQANPGVHTASLMLNDRQGKYVDQNPNSIYFDKLGSNVPMRVSVRPHHTDGPLADVEDTFSRTVTPTAINTNPSLETGDTTGWTGVNASIAVSQVWASDGDYSCFVTPNGVSSVGGAHSDMVSGLTPGNVYELWYRVKPTNTMTFEPAINWHDSSAVFLSTSFGTIVNVPGGTEALINVVATAPASATRAVARVRFTSTPSASDTFYFDEATLESVTEGGWGQPDSGQDAYVGWGGGGSIYSNQFRVKNGKGIQRVPTSNAYRVCTLEDLYCIDFDETIRFTCPQAVGARLEPASIAFRGVDTSTYDLARVEVLTTNEVQCKIIDRDGTNVTTVTVSGLTHLGESQPLKMRTLVLGHDVFMKVWIAADSEPELWHAYGYLPSAPVYGWKGIRSGVGSGNTNTRPVEFTYDDLTFTFEEPRSCTEVAEWPSSWDITGNDVYIPIVGAGLRRRLGKGAKPLRSPHTRAIIAASTPPDAYWPLEDSSDANRAASGLNNRSPMVPYADTAPPSFGNTGIILGSASYASFTEGGTLVGANDNWDFNGNEFAIDFVVSIDGPASGAITDTLVLEWYSNSSHSKFECHCSNNKIEVKHFNASGTQVAEAEASNVTVFAKQPKHIRYHSEQNGFEFLSRLYIDGVLAATAVAGGGSLTGVVREITSVFINPLEATEIFAPNVSQVVIWGANAPDVADMAFAAHGYVGETAGERLVRLGEENGFTVDIRGDSADSAAMGPQPTDTLLKVMDLAAQTDLGLLYESRHTLGFEFRTRADIYNAFGLDLSYSAKLFTDELKPTTDDRLLVNSVTGRRYGGGEYTFALEEGKRSIQDYPNGAGLYEVSLDFNTEDDAGLVAPTQFTVARGTVIDRIPFAKVNLARSVFTANQSLTAQILELDLLDRLNITDLPAWLPPKDYHTLIQGYDELINGLGSWEIAWHTVPYDPFNAAIWETSRFDTDSSVTSSAITSGTTTSFTVDTSTGATLWVTGSGAPEFPIQVSVAGVILNVTAISGTTSPQTFTVDATPLNGVIKVIPVGSKISNASPTYFSY